MHTFFSRKEYIVSIVVRPDETRACYYAEVHGKKQVWYFTGLSKRELVCNPKTGKQHELLFVDCCVNQVLEFGLSIDGTEPAAWIAGEPITDYVINERGITVIFDRNSQSITYPWPEGGQWQKITRHCGSAMTFLKRLFCK